MMRLARIAVKDDALMVPSTFGKAPFYGAKDCAHVSANSAAVFSNSSSSLCAS